MTELTSMYSYLKIMSEGNNKVTGFPGAEYHHPRPLSETYMIPPSIPRPVMDNYQVPPAARPFNPLSSSPQDTELEGYMEMRPPVVELNTTCALANYTTEVGNKNY
uniref:Uncharacterized protein n=1 Tax=Timema douglasi TaxID=61478 RepID=A0A7R8VYT4_TIMDO|nr:unnamed protein product [Timema douglasi]